MDRKTAIWIGVFVGSTVGGFVPSLWGAGMLSYSGLIASSIGSLVGIWVAWKVTEE